MSRLTALARLALLAALVVPTAARAHQNTTVFLELELRGSGVELALRATPFDLAPTLDLVLPTRADAEAYRRRSAVVLRNIASYLTVDLGDGRLCRVSRQRIDIERGMVIARLAYRCPRPAETLELRYDLLFGDDPAHRAFVVGRVGGGPPGRAPGRLVADRRGGPPLALRATARATAPRRCPRLARIIHAPVPSRIHAPVPSRAAPGLSALGNAGPRRRPTASHVAHGAALSSTPDLCYQPWVPDRSTGLANGSRPPVAVESRWKADRRGQ